MSWTADQKKRAYDHYKGRPERVIRELLQIKYLTDKQIEIIHSVWNNKRTIVPSGHSLGKSFIAGAIVLSFLYTHKNSIVITTAPTHRQVKDILWKNIRELHKGGRGLSNKIPNVMDFELAESWFAVGISPQTGAEEESAVRMQGYHAKKILVVIDEACGVSNAVWEAVDGILSSEGSRCLAIGNPSVRNVPFHKNTKKKGWHVINMSAFDHPNVKQEREVIPGAVSIDWVQEKIDEWCQEIDSHDPEESTFDWNGKIYLPNNIFKWKVLGVFPSDSETGLISAASIQTAMNSEIKEGFDFVHMAVDIARFGDDQTLATTNQGDNFIQKAYRKLDNVEVVKKIIPLIVQHKPSKVAIDADGTGSGVFDILKEKRKNGEIFEIDEHGKKVPIEFQLIAIHSGSKQVEKIRGKKVTAVFANLRAQMYWQLRLDMINLNIPKDELLEEELNMVDYDITPRGAILIMGKEDMKASLGRSPDKMDSLVYCNWMKYVKERRLQVYQRI